MLKRIAIDLTPLLPGGDNGGAKPLAIELIRHLGKTAPQCGFILLTSEASHAELACLDASNIRRFCVTRPENARSLARKMALRVRQAMLKILPGKVVQKAGEVYSAALERTPERSSLLRQVEAELLFCPFTGALFFDPSVPVVSLVHDLQYLYYPQFFTPESRYERDRHFRQVCRVATRLICVSEDTRAKVLEHSGLPAERVVTVLSAPQERLAKPGPAAAGRALETLRLKAGRYLLYPANFWRHKNHEVLLIAFGMYRSRHPRSDLKLVLTGAPSPRSGELMEAARRAGLADWVVFPGYLPDEDFAALLAHSAAVVFPSLFEGFGMPVLEAMAAGVPVLASNLTSLPEVAGDAALLFDPRRPTEVVEAITRLETDPALRPALVEKGRRRVASFAGPADMAAGYFAVFQDAVRYPVERPPALYGVFPDAWTSDRVTVVFGNGTAPRRLTVTFKAPGWIPSDAVSIRVLPDPSGRPEIHRIPRGEEKSITRDLPEKSGMVEFLCSPTFQPARFEAGGDTRSLGCHLESAAILEPNGNVQPLHPEADAA